VTTFTVPGHPVPKGRPRLARNGHVYTPLRTREYEYLAGWCALRSGLALERGRAYRIEVECRFADRRRRDGDNLLKAIVDGISAPFTDFDDCQFVSKTVTKTHVETAAEECAVVRVEEH